ncbi:hypothetical protein PV963_16260 [Streptomyces coeruleorubidus]|uniref:hypothetical protein n=1 Tax=Streptomyces coeruleorubidus TaxID=116188 RepID=UPI00237F2043|nr:hypothetical protein [Streptomyces coeruleorubidus]WDV51817.1 hypothetical protein PV963_16260 [Streptomyces coeruleorubidus]
MMKSLKAAALVVGSLFIAGAAAPAGALDAPKAETADLTEEANKVRKHVEKRLADYRPEALDTANKSFRPSALKQTKNALDRESARLAPGLPAQS